MTQHSLFRAMAPGAVFAVILSGAMACGGSKTDDLQAAQADSALVPPATPVVAPPIADEPVTPPPRPVSKAPARKPPAKSSSTAVSPPVTTPVSPPTTSAPPARPPAETFATVPSGSEFAVRPSVKVCTNTHKVGDHVAATVSEGVGEIPAGAVATLEVTKAQYGNNDMNKVSLDFRVVSLEINGHTYDVNGTDVTPAEVTVVRRQSTGDQAKKVAVGAVAGAVVGRIIGKSTKATVVGGAIGGVAGAAAAAGTADYDGCVAADSRVTVRLTEDLRVRAS